MNFTALQRKKIIFVFVVIVNCIPLAVNQSSSDQNAPGSVSN